jgi:hypothetical protein
MSVGHEPALLRPPHGAVNNEDTRLHAHDPDRAAINRPCGYQLPREDVSSYTPNTARLHDRYSFRLIGATPLALETSLVACPNDVFVFPKA